MICLWEIGLVWKRPLEQSPTEGSGCPHLIKQKTRQFEKATEVRLGWTCFSVGLSGFNGQYFFWGSTSEHTDSTPWPHRIPCCKGGGEGRLKIGLMTRQVKDRCLRGHFAGRTSLNSKTLQKCFSAGSVRLPHLTPDFDCHPPSYYLFGKFKSLLPDWKENNPRWLVLLTKITI